MKKVLEVTILGHPVGAARPRVVMKRDRSGVMSYMPKEHVRWEKKASLAAMATLIQAPGGGSRIQPRPLTGPVGLTLLAIHPRPGRLRRKMDTRDRVRCTGKPDLDNVLKLAMDALSKAKVYRDDNQVCLVRAEAWYQEIGDHAVGGKAPDAEPTRVVVCVFDLEAA